MKAFIRLPTLVFLALLWTVTDSRAFLDPTIGRWASRDPVGENGGINLHAFIFNAPKDDVDPFGLSACKSTYKWVVRPPNLNVDLQSPQTMAFNTTIRIGLLSTVVQRQLSISGLWGLTITEPSLLGG